MSFKFAVGQEVLRVDSTTGVPWGTPVVITHRNVLVLPAHNLCEKRYMFKDGGYSHEYPESALMDAIPIVQDMEQMVGRAGRPGGFTPKPKKLSWWSWLFHD